jgi:hypothetical protein
MDFHIAVKYWLTGLNMGHSSNKVILELDDEQVDLPPELDLIQTVGDEDSHRGLENILSRQELECRRQLSIRHFKLAE